MAGPDLASQDVIDALDSFYCHNVEAALWADAVANRLEGFALVVDLLAGETHRRADVRAALAGQ